MQDIHIIRPPVKVGFDPMLLTIIFMVIGVAALLLLLFFVIKKYLKKRKQPKGLKYLPEPMAPYEAAVKELDLLLHRTIGDPRLFYFDLTIVLRKYISRSFAINAVEMTSQEFIKSINLLDLDKGVKQNIARFLKSSDPYKYAGIVPEKDRANEDLLFIRDQISQIENRLKQELENKKDKGEQ